LVVIPCPNNDISRQKCAYALPEQTRRRVRNNMLALIKSTL